MKGGGRERLSAECEHFAQTRMRHDDAMINTTERVFELLKEHDLSVYKLCRMSDISSSTLYTTMRRNGQLSVDTIERICDAIGITMSEFFCQS